MTSSLPFEDDRCNNAWWKIRMNHNYFFKSHNPQIFSSRERPKMEEKTYQEG